MSKCIRWRGRHDKDGYARGNRAVLVYRERWIAKYGPVPEGLELDHTCAHRWCINEDHLEPVTHLENVRRAWARKTTCRNGHRKTPESFPPGGRCLICRRASDRARQQRHRQRRRDLQ